MKNPRLLGVLGGLLAGILLVLAGWRVLLILLAFGAGGYLLGAHLGTWEDLPLWLRRLYRRIFRS